MKKKAHLRGLLAVLLASSLFLLASCGGASSAGGKTPEETYESFMSALQKGDAEAAQALLFNNDAAPTIMTFSADQSASIAALSAGATCTIAGKQEIEAGQAETKTDAEGTEEQTSTEVSGAMLQITVSGKDTLDVSSQVSAAITADLASFSAMKVKEKDKFVASSIQTALGTAPAVEQSVGVALVQEDGVWKIRDAKSLVTAIFGDGSMLDPIN